MRVLKTLSPLQCVAKIIFLALCSNFPEQDLLPRPPSFQLPQDSVENRFQKRIFKNSQMTTRPKRYVRDVGIYPIGIFN